jgi:hypothetical protein
MPEANLFGEPMESVPCAKLGRVAKVMAPKLIRAQRHQVMLLPTNLEDLLPEDHIARGMWTLVGKLDLSRFLAAIETRENEAGRPAIDPRILVTLWLYATSEGVGSDRRKECVRLHSPNGVEERRSSSPPTWRTTRHRCMEVANGDRESQGDLQGTGGNGRVHQRGSQMLKWPGSIPRPDASESHLRRLLGGDRLQHPETDRPGVT